MVTVRDLKAMLGLDTSNFMTGMRNAAKETKGFKDSLRTAAKNYEQLEIIINQSKLDKSKIPSNLKISLDKKTLIDSLQKHMKDLDKIGKAGFFLTVNKTALKESIDKWIKSLRSGASMTKLPLKVDKEVLENSVLAAIKDMRKDGNALFRRKENMIPLRVDDGSIAGKKISAVPSGGDDIKDILEKILNAIGTDAKSLKEHVDESGKSGGMETFGGGGGMFK